MDTENVDVDLGTGRTSAEEPSFTMAEVAQIVMELDKSKRYRDFVQANYDIIKQIDEDSQEVRILVIEKPVVVGPKLSGGQIVKLQAVLSGARVENAPQVLEKILECLGQESEIIITT